MPETLFLTFHIIDPYLIDGASSKGETMEQVLRRELQLVGVSSMLIAPKYEEMWAPQVDDFICISDWAYSHGQILAMEKSILNKLEWSLTVPTPYVFTPYALFKRLIKAEMCDKEMEHMVFFFAELGLIQYSMITCCPSMVAALAVYASRCTLKKTPIWTRTLKHHTGFSESQLLYVLALLAICAMKWSVQIKRSCELIQFAECCKDCAHILANSHSAAPKGKLKAVYKKYSSLDLGAVQPSAVKFMEVLKAASSASI